jgi:DNA-binding IclR family transcriptional regulator
MTPSAIAILTALRSAATAEDIAPLAGLPLFRVRSALRELVAAGLVAVVDDGRHSLTEAGIARL